MFQALALLRLTAVHLLKAQGAQINHQGEAVIGAGSAWARKGGPIAREEPEGRRQGRQRVERQPLLAQRDEERRTPLPPLPDGLIRDPLGAQRERSRDFPQGVSRPARQQDRAAQCLRGGDVTGLRQRASFPHHRFPIGRTGVQERRKLGIDLGRGRLHGHFS
jgi:hypothetical protein